MPPQKFVFNNVSPSYKKKVETIGNEQIQTALIKPSIFIPRFRSSLKRENDFSPRRYWMSL